MSIYTLQLKKHPWIAILGVAVFIFVFILSTPMQVIAAGSGVDSAQSGLQQTAGQAGFSDAQDPTDIAASIVNIVLGFLGTIFLILIIWSGFQWMTAGGNTETITKARSRLINAVIGLIIVMSAWLIASFVIGRLVEL